MLSIADAPPIPKDPPTEATGPTDGLEDSPTPQDKRHKPKGHRRLSKARERQHRYVLAAVPHGSSRARRGTDWLQDVSGDAEIAMMRADAQRNIRRISVALLGSLHAKTMTVSPGWAWLMESTQLSESTVKRTIRLLRRRGLLGLVAGGRCAEYGAAGQTTNDRAIYVLARPQEETHVDTSGRPTPGGVRSTPRARETLSKLKAKGAATPLDPSTAEAYGLAPPPLELDRTLPTWPANQPIQGRTRRERHEAGLAAARTLQQRSFALRGTSAAWVLWATKPFLEAGWTPLDVLHATDNHPQNKRIAHDGADGVRFPGRWLAARLDPWLKDGRPTKSRSQQQRAWSDQAAADRRAAEQRRSKRRALIAQPPAETADHRLGDARGKAIALAVLRGDLTPEQARQKIREVTECHTS